MDQAVRRYVARVLMLHLAFLGVVLLVVALAGRALYASAEAEAEGDALDRLDQSAAQAALALERHFGGIFDTLAAADRSPPRDRPQSRPAFAVGRASATRPALPPVGESLWAQLRGRSSDLLVLRVPDDEGGAVSVRQHYYNAAPAADESLQDRTPAEATILASVPPELYTRLPDRPAINRLLGGAGPTLRRAVQSGEATMSGPLEANASTGPVVLAVVPLTRPEPREPGAAPSPGQTVVAIVLPSEYLQQGFLAPAGEANVRGMLLFDAVGRLVAGGDVALAGREAATLVPEVMDASLGEFVARTVDGAGGSRREYGRVSLGDLEFERTLALSRAVRPLGRSATAAAPATRAAAAGATGDDGPPATDADMLTAEGRGRLWVIALADREAVVRPLAETTRRATLWAIAVVVAMTAILVSSAVQLIRGRNRLERLRSEMIEKELDEARRIQLMWLPEDETRETPTSHIEVAAENVPASHISGDFYNYFALDKGRYALVIGDVTGHGMAAAFLMATTQLLINTTLKRIGDPGRTLEEVNDLLCSQAFHGQFVTLCLIVIDPVGERMLVASAGHPPPLTCEPGGRWHPLGADSQLVLGVMPGSEYPTQELPLPRCDAMLLYTDGLIEAKGLSGERFSMEELCDMLGRRVGSESGSAKALAEATLEIVRDFTGGADLDDDLTLLAVRLVPTEPGGGSSDDADAAEEEGHEGSLAVAAINDA